MNNVLEQLKKFWEAFKKLSMLRKGILAGIVVAVVVAVIFTFSFSTSEPQSLLFQKPLTMEQFGTITAELDKMGIQFSTRDDKYIIVQDEEEGAGIRMRLAQENKLPSGIKGWELFDMQSWTTTEFDRNINLRRALAGEMQKHLMTLEWVENATVTLDMPEQRLYTVDEKPIQAAVSITPSPGYYDNLRNKKMIRGIESIISMGIDGLSSENITITDSNGLTLNDFSDDDVESNIKQAVEENKIRDRERQKIENNVRSAMRGVLPEDRYTVAVELELSFDRKSVEQKDILPIVIKERTPGLAYDDSEVIPNLPVSSKVVKEEFRGPGFIPEGPPGQEPNIPPGYKEHQDQFTRYNKDEEIINNITGEKHMSVQNDATEIVRKSVSVTVDGTWKKELDEKGNPIFEGETYRREYSPYPEDELKKIEEVVQGAINYNATRGDLVRVRNIRFDRSEQFRLEDVEYLRQQRFQRVLVLLLLVLLGLFALTIVYRLVRKEILRRRRIRERELARQRQMQRDEALRALETETPTETLSDEDKKRMDLQERAEQLAVERPEDVAKLVRSWIAED